MDIEVVIKRTFYYSLFVFLSTLVYILMIFVAYEVFQQGSNVKSTVVTNLIVVIMLAALFKPIEALVHRILDNIFFKGGIAEISSQKAELERELERTARLKSVGILASGMAHEIKNPLSAINTFVEYLPKKYHDPKFRDDFQRILKSETGRIKTIVHDLLAFSRPHPPKKEPTDLNKIIQDELTLLSSDLIKNHIQTTTHLDKSLPLLNLDPSQMKQALLNIILNAIDAMKESPTKTLNITTKKNEQKVIISIQDTGEGIDPDKIKHLFDPFYTQKEHGTGLGLAITLSIIEQHGGQLHVKSHLGLSTEFYIDLNIR